MALNLWTIRDYTGFQNCTGASPVFFHPNGNQWVAALEKDSSGKQNISIYKMVPGVPTWHLYRTLEAGVDVEGNYAVNNCGISIDKYGAAEITFAARPKGITNSIYQNWWAWIPNVDEPYKTTKDLEQELLELHEINNNLVAWLQSLTTANDLLTQQLAQLQIQVDNLPTITTIELSTGDRQAIAWATAAKNIQIT